MARNWTKAGIVLFGFIEAEEGSHEACAFTYKPMMGQDAWDLDSRINRELQFSDNSAGKIQSKEIASRITWWSEEGETDGEMWPITPENLASLHPRLYPKIVAIVKGLRASDSPEKGSADDLALIAAQQKAIAEGKLPGPAVVDSILKN